MGNAATPERTIYDVQADLDLDDMLAAAVPPPACEWQTKTADDTFDPETCGAPATMMMSLSCGHSYYYDDEHGEIMRAQLTGHVVSCDNPHAPRHLPHVRVSVRFDRIPS